MIAVLSILAGAALGTRYKVLCLVPAMLIGIAAIAARDFLQAVPLASTIRTSLMVAVGLQVGYVAITVRSALLAARARIAQPRRVHERPVRIV
jgi:cation transporter-like permease